MIPVVLAIIVSSGAGAVMEHFWEDRSLLVTDRAIQLLLYVLLPFITFFVVARLDLHAGVGAGLALAWVQILAVGAIAWALSVRVLRLERRAAGTVVICCMLANTGYLGIPLNAALLGQDAIGPAIAWDVAVSAPVLFTFGFGIAAACGTRAGDGFRQRLRAFFTRNPPLLALVAGLLVPDSLAPDVMVDVARAAAFVLLPVGFFVLGAHLAREREAGSFSFPPALSAPVATVVALRLLVAPALFALLALSVDRVPDAYRLQAAMPCGVNALVAAHTYGLDLRLAASAVAWTTGLSVTVAVVAGLVL